jgi:hypothetical protein
LPGDFRDERRPNSGYGTVQRICLQSDRAGSCY